MVGIKLAINHVTLVLSDFAGTLFARRDIETDTVGSTREGFPALLVDLVARFLAEEGVAVSRIAEIAIAAQGFVDTRSGSLMWSPAFRERNIRLVDPLVAAFGAPCAMSNDANMIAEALHAADPDTYSGTFAVIFVDYGVGMGLFVGNQLHQGAHGSAAEFGHVSHLPGGPLCRCGRRGCLEAFTADYAIFRDARGLPPDTDPLDASPTPGDLVALEAAAYAGDAHVRGVYAGVGRALGTGIAARHGPTQPEPDRADRRVDPGVATVPGRHARGDRGGAGRGSPPLHGDRDAALGARPDHDRPDLRRPQAAGARRLLPLRQRPPLSRGLNSFGAASAPPEATGRRDVGTWLVRPSSGRGRRSIAARRPRWEDAMSKIEPCIWYDGAAEEAARFYVSLLPDSRIEHVQRSPVDTPGCKAGDVLLVRFTLSGQSFLGLNGGPGMEHSFAMSLTIYCETQDEIDHLGRPSATTAGARSSAAGSPTGGA